MYSLKLWLCGDHFWGHLEIWQVDHANNLNLMSLLVSLSQKHIFRHLICNCIICTCKNIALFVCGCHFGRHLRFHTLRMFRKNANLIFFKAYDTFFPDQVSSCLDQKNTRNYKWAYTKHHKIKLPVKQNDPKLTLDTIGR